MLSLSPILLQYAPLFIPANKRSTPLIDPWDLPFVRRSAEASHNRLWMSPFPLRQILPRGPASARKVTAKQAQNSPPSRTSSASTVINPSPLPPSAAILTSTCSKRSQTACMMSRRSGVCAAASPGERRVTQLRSGRFPILPLRRHLPRFLALNSSARVACDWMASRAKLDSRCCSINPPGTPRESSMISRIPRRSHNRECLLWVLTIRHDRQTKLARRRRELWSWRWGKYWTMWEPQCEFFF